jgi:hypothetical protein
MNMHRHQGISRRRARPTRILKEPPSTRGARPEARPILSASRPEGALGWAAGVGSTTGAAAQLGPGWREGWALQPALLKNETREGWT